MKAVVLVCSQNFAGAKLREEGNLTDIQDYHKWPGRALPSGVDHPGEPRRLALGDGVRGRELFRNDSAPAIIEMTQTDHSANEPRVLQGKKGATVIELARPRAKQILITGRNFKRRLDRYVGYADG